MDTARAEAEAERGSSPTRSAQEVLRRMSLNSPPSRADNPRQIKRAKLLAGEAGGPASRAFAVPQAAQTPGPATVRKLVPPASRAALDGPSPMPSWGVNLRDASAGEALEASDHDPSSLYPSFQLDCLRQPYGGPSSAKTTSTTMDDDEDDDYQDNTRHHASLRSMGSESDIDDTHEPSPCPARLQMDDSGGHAGGRRRGGGGGFAAALEEARGAGGGAAGVPETPFRRPGSGARSRVLERGGAGRGDGSCSPIGGYAGLDGSAAQGSPVKKRGAGRWRLSEEGRRNAAAQQQQQAGTAAAGFHDSPLRSNHNPFSPDSDDRERGGASGSSSSSSSSQGDPMSMSMPAPAPRSRLSTGGAGGASEGSPMDTGDVADGVDSGSLVGGDKGDEGSFLRRVSVGSCSSSSAAVPTTGGKKTVADATRPSPCDVASFVPVTPCTPCRGGGNGSGRVGVDGMFGMANGEGDGAPMSPVSRAGSGVDVPAHAVRKAGGGDGATERGGRGRFATDFEVKEVIGTGGFGTVYKVRSRVDGCLYAVKCSRRRFKGESDRQNMLMEVYALAAVCDSAQETINIVRYHQAWIEDERLYIQTELCETSLEKQLESGHRLEIEGVYAFLRQTLLGLEILHQHKLVHLDIKPGNIFVKNGQYKLGDFGLVTPVHVRSGTDVVEGDSRYMSKELLNDDHSNLTKCDVFSLGITMYEIISGRPLPPNGEEWHSLRSGKAGMPMGLPAELSKTLHEMMHPDPSRRPSAAELLRYPCLQSEMERQLNDQRSKLNKERSRNSGLVKEVSALIQKQSQRTGRLSRTITWDNSYFAANGGKGGNGPSNPPLPTKALGGTPDHLASRSGGGMSGVSAVGARFSPTPVEYNAKASGFFGGGESGPARFGASMTASSGTGGAVGGVAGSSFGQGMLGLSSVQEKEEEEAAVSPMTGGWSAEARGGGGVAEGSRPAAFERLRQAER
eukprot:g15940.t1